MESFYDITKDILENKIFKLLKDEDHHGDNRYNHTKRVAMEVYKYTKENNMDYVRATRAALLHDFFFRVQLETPRGKGELYEHPKVACKNAKKIFKIDSKTEEMMINHMYPVTRKKPKSPEGVAISLIDKKISIIEFVKYKVKKENNKIK